MMTLAKCVLVLFCTTGIVEAATIDLDWTTISIKSIQDLIQSGVSCRNIMESFLNRITRLEQTPHLGAMITINANVLNEADTLDQQYKLRNRIIGPLHCIPVLPKDIIDAANIPTTGGLNALKTSVPNRSSAVVSSLTNQGAIVIGKANLSPLAGSSTFSDSETGGLVRNPFNLARTAYGSSGGNGAGGAAVYTIVGLGTDTSGSVVLPSSAGNLIGLRPTMDKFSLEGVLAGNHMQDTVGPMVRWAEDLATVMDSLDPSARGAYPAKYSNPQILNLNGLRGLRVGILTMLVYGEFSIPVPGKNKVVTYKLSDDARTLVNNALYNLQSAGAVITNQTAISLSDISEVLMKMLMMPVQLAACKPQWFDTYLAAVNGQKAFQNFQQMKDSPLLPQNIRSQLQRAWQIRNQCPSAIQAFQQGKQEFIQKAISPVLSDVDVLIYPTIPTVPELIVQADEDSITGVQLAPFSGYPSINIPIGFSPPDSESKQGLPFGLTFMAKPNREDILVRVAYAYQKNFGVVKVPWTLGGGTPGEEIKSPITDRFAKLARMVSDFFKRIVEMFSG